MQQNSCTDVSNVDRRRFNVLDVPHRRRISIWCVDLQKLKKQEERSTEDVTDKGQYIHGSINQWRLSWNRHASLVIRIDRQQIDPLHVCSPWRETRIRRANKTRLLYLQTRVHDAYSLYCYLQHMYLNIYEGCSENNGHIRFLKKIFIYSSTFMLSPSK